MKALIQPDSVTNRVFELGDMIWRPKLTAGITQSASFYAPLTTSVVPIKGGAPTFVRATPATVQDHDGIWRQALAGEVRFTGAKRVQNFVPFSNDFANVAWDKSPGGTGLAPVVTADYGVAPNGAAATRVVFDLNGGVAGADISQLAAFTTAVDVKIGDTFATSIYIKSNTGTPYTLILVGPQGVAGVVFATTEWTRVVTATVSTLAAALVSPLRLRLRGNEPSSKYADVSIACGQSENVSGAGNKAPGEYVSVGVEPGPIYHGAMVDGVRYFDPTNGAVAKGVFIEGARTNICLQSNNLLAAQWTLLEVTLGAVIQSPSGSIDANSFSQDGPSATVSQGGQVFVAGQTLTVSRRFKKYGTSPAQWALLYIATSGATTRAWFDLTAGVKGGNNPSTGTHTYVSHQMRDEGNGWYACSLSVTIATDTLATQGFFAATGDLQNTRLVPATMATWNGQTEVGAFPSSPIYTAAAAVTRDADLLSYPGAGVVDSARGAVYLEHRRDYLAEQNAFLKSISISDNTTGNRVYFQDVTGATPGNQSISSEMFSGGISQAVASFNFSGAQTTEQFKSAQSWELNNYQASVNGLTPVVDTACLAPIGMNLISIGGNPNNALQAYYGYVRNVRVWMQPLTGQELQRITA